MAISTIIVTGFLGAGKTTLLNRILTGRPKERIAVIVNEFGAVGVDQDLLLSARQNVIEMSNGCICCSVNGDLVRGLFELISRAQSIDKLIIETTGLAEPGPVVQALYSDAAIRQAFVLEGVVTVVDAKHVTNQLEETREASEQIAFADLVVLNKTDLLGAEELDGIEARVREVNRFASLTRARNAEVDLEELLRPRLYDISRHEFVHDSDGHDVDGHQEHDGHTHPHPHRRHNHLHDIMTVCVIEPRAADSLKLSLWFRSYLAEIGPRLLRMKGILNLHGDPDQFVFQGVQAQIEGRPGRRWSSLGERGNRLVFIGRALDEAALVEGFRRCLFEGASSATALIDPFGRSDTGISPQLVDQLRFWMRRNFQLPPATPVLIKEVPCVKAGCPPIETSIVVMPDLEPPRHYKIQKPISEVTFDHVYDLIENPMPCC